MTDSDAREIVTFLPFPAIADKGRLRARNIIVDQVSFHRSKTMWLIILLIILVLLFGGGGFYVGPPYHYFGGGLSLILVIIILVLLFRG